MQRLLPRALPDAHSRASPRSWRSKRARVSLRGRRPRLGQRHQPAGAARRAPTSASATVVLVGCNRAGAAAVERAAAGRVPTCLVDRAAIPSRAERQSRLLRRSAGGARRSRGPGWFRRNPAPRARRRVPGRILNTHPSLLPAFGGTMHAVQAGAGARRQGHAAARSTWSPTSSTAGRFCSRPCVPIGPRRRRARRCTPASSNRSTACCRLRCAHLPRVGCGSRANAHA